MLIELNNATVTFLKNTDFEVKALNDVSFSLRERESVGVIGPIGSGKSSFGQALTGLLRLDKGLLRVGSKDVPKELASDKVYSYGSYLFQKPEKQLFEDTVYNEVAFGPKNLGFTKEEVDEAVKEALMVVGLDFNEYAIRSPFELSGGEMRRVGIAATLSLGSKSLILDEPTAGLDAQGKMRIISFLQQIKGKRSIVLISHDLEEVLRVCDRLIVINKGKIALDIASEQIFKHKDYLASIGLLLPDEYVLIEELRKCGYKLRGLAHNEILASIEERISG